MKEEMGHGHEGEYRSPDEFIKAMDEYVDYDNNQRIVTNQGQHLFRIAKVSKNSYCIYASWVPNLSNKRKLGHSE